MKQFFVYLIALITGGIIISIDQSTEAMIAAGAAVVLAAGLPAIVDILKPHLKISAAVPAFTGFFIALGVAGLAAPLFEGINRLFVIAGAGVLSSITAYVFYLYQQDIGFAFIPHNRAEKESVLGGDHRVKILDTSIIIDGRIIDIAGTGFIEPPFVVPNFVLREIQLISDSADPIKRNRGRRGLDMLNQLQKREDLEVRISYKDYTDTREVDAKLVKLAHELGAKLVTNDFNLNKVAELQGVSVLNINNLANALKPVVLPGEEMEIQVVKEGKDDNQGIGYLDDGTMVVIENGGRLMGKRVTVNVTSVIQTNAGKMIFTKVSGDNRDSGNNNSNNNNRGNNRKKESRDNRK